MTPPRRCPGCAQENAPGAITCVACGKPIPEVANATLDSVPRATVPDVARGDARARFQPGDKLGKRYRIVALIGRGGMGEVYRADDLELGQSVALKFLPARIASSPPALHRFRNEVRTARQVTHPNVCRIHDIGEEDGHVFLIMEHVDGEDLASLLRRIGRPSNEKAVEIARQLCAGLAAAHHVGVLHRDLKPSNVMIDGRGRVRLTDFGLAGMAEDLARGGEVEGTPAYMAPEQLAGRGVTVRSDVYSMGLVLYELFTGRRALEGRTLAELKQEHQSGSITTPSAHVRDLDPAVERVIERCLEKDPSQRPASAHAVLRALPGGDPLAEVLAAGETPSPELIAHAGDAGGLPPRVALGVLAGTVSAILVAWLVLPAGLSGPRLNVPAQPPDVLAVRADDALRALGWGEVFTGHPAAGLFLDPGFIEPPSATPPPEAASTATRRRPGVTFWRRWSVDPLRPTDFHEPAVQWDNPPLTVSGQAGVMLDASGRLEVLAIDVQPSEIEPPAATPEAPPVADWVKLFELAALDVGRYHSMQPSRGAWGGTPTDVSASWEGPWPDDPDRTLRLHAGARSGRPVYWEIDWKPGRKTAAPLAWLPEALDAAPDTWITKLMKFWRSPSWAGWRDSVIWICAIALAWRHARSGRGDRRGAIRVGAFVALLYWLAGWFLFVPQSDSLGDVVVGSFFSEHLGHALVHGASLVVFYLALEPYGRRLWPRMLVAWSRLLQGRVTDPLVGREVLIGGAIAAATYLGFAGILHLGVATGLARWPSPPPGYLPGIGSGATLAFDLLASTPRAVLMALVSVLPLLIWRLLLRRAVPAVAAAFVMIVFTTYGNMMDPTQPGLELACAVLMSATTMAVLLRVGLLAYTTFLWVSLMFVVVIPAAAAGSWARVPQLGCLAAMFVVLGLGAWTSMAGRPILGGLLDEKPAGS